MSEPHATPGPLLVAYDGSERSRCAIERAAALLPGHRALVLHVYEPVVPLVPTPAGVALAADVEATGYDAERAEEVVRERAGDVSEQGARVAERAGLAATSETTVARGTAGIAEAIVDKAAEIGAALIVVGSHGRSAIGAALLGSVSTAVLHRSHLPVLVVPARVDAED